MRLEDDASLRETTINNTLRLRVQFSEQLHFELSPVTLVSHQTIGQGCQGEIGQGARFFSSETSGGRITLSD